MNVLFLIAAILGILMAAAHSFMGERYFLTGIMKPESANPLGNEQFINRTIRTAWHLTSLAWCGLSFVLLAMAVAPPAGFSPVVAVVVALFYFLSAVLSAVGSHGRHLSWIVFLVITVLIWAGI